MVWWKFPDTTFASRSFCLFKFMFLLFMCNMLKILWISIQVNNCQNYDRVNKFFSNLRGILEFSQSERIFLIMPASLECSIHCRPFRALSGNGALPCWQNHTCYRGYSSWYWTYRNDVIISCYQPDSYCAPLVVSILKNMNQWRPTYTCLLFSILDIYSYHSTLIYFHMHPIHHYILLYIHLLPSSYHWCLWGKWFHRFLKYFVAQLHFQTHWIIYGSLQGTNLVVVLFMKASQGTTEKHWVN